MQNEDCGPGLGRTAAAQVCGYVPVPIPPTLLLFLAQAASPPTPAPGPAWSPSFLLPRSGVSSSRRPSCSPASEMALPLSPPTQYQAPTFTRWPGPSQTLPPLISQEIKRRPRGVSPKAKQCVQPERGLFRVSQASGGPRSPDSSPLGCKSHHLSNVRLGFLPCLMEVNRVLPSRK